MTAKIVTDSAADLPLDLARELGITIVPIYVRFGDKVYWAAPGVFEVENDIKISP